jgi:hypothetical protein
MIGQNREYIATAYGNATVPTLFDSDVTATATAKAKSFISQEDAQKIANKIANQNAFEIAVNKSNIINQAVNIVKSSFLSNKMSSSLTTLTAYPYANRVSSFSKKNYSEIDEKNKLGYETESFTDYKKEQINSVSIGKESGQYNQRERSISIGVRSGSINQEINSIAIGSCAGQKNQQNNSVAIGYAAGNSGQQSNSIALGHAAGYSSQQSNSIAIGIAAGFNNQGENSIAIGSSAGYKSIAGNSIIVNASGSDLNSNKEGCFISPIDRFDSNETGPTGLMIYNMLSKEINYEPNKTFVIDHPIHSEKYLVHACLEGPESGVYYRGEGSITNNEYSAIILPEYVSHIATNLSVQVMQKLDDINDRIVPIATTMIKNNKFNVCGKNCHFWWTVFGKRMDIHIEPNKKDVEIMGTGPYKWIRE